MVQQIDWPGLVSALILLITAITLAINLWNQRQIGDLHNKVTQIDGALQAQMSTKQDKAIRSPGDTQPLNTRTP